MKLIPNAKRIMLKAHSMWANYLGILCLLAPEAIYYFTQIDTNPRLWWIAGVALIIYGIIGRVKDQGISRSPFAVMIFAIAMSVPQAAEPEPTGVSRGDFLDVAVPLVAKWEGLRTTAYLDTIASPPVWTVCYGETKGVKQGDSYTVKECEDMLVREVLEYRERLHRYFLPVTLEKRLTPERDAAYVSLAYNVGVHACGHSTATRRLNAGNIAGGCQAIGWWNKAGKRVLRGLVNRRANETRLCMKGLA